MAFPTSAVQNTDNYGVHVDRTNAHFADPSQHVQRADNMTAMKAMAPADGDLVYLLGYYNAGDGGGGMFRYVSTDSTNADNGGTIIQKTGGGTGRFHRLWEGQEANILWFGAKRDDTGDQTARIHAAQDAVYTATDDAGQAITLSTNGIGMGGRVYFPRGMYRCTTAITPKSFVGWRGEDMNSSILHWASTGVFVSASGSGQGYSSHLRDLCLFGDQTSFTLYQAINNHRTQFHRVYLRGTHNDSSAPGGKVSRPNQIGSDLQVTYGDNSWSQCFYTNLGVAVRPMDIGNSWNGCTFMYNRIDFDGSTGDNSGAQVANCTMAATEVAVDETLSFSNFYLPRSSNMWHITNTRMEGAARPVVLGDIANMAAGGPIMFGMVNCTIGTYPTSYCIELPQAKQTAIIHCRFTALGGAPAGAFLFPSGHNSPEGICISPLVVNAVTQPAPEDFPARWNFLGRFDSKMPDGGVLIGDTGTYVHSGASADPNGIVSAKRGSFYISSATGGGMFQKTLGNTVKPFDDQNWFRIPGVNSITGLHTFPTDGSTISLANAQADLKGVTANGADRTGAIMAAGTFSGQRITLLNRDTAFSITFAASGSRVNAGSSCVIPPGKGVTFVWDSGISRWITVGG